MNNMSGLGRPRLQMMHAAGIEALQIQRDLAARKSNLVAEILKDEGEFFEQEHYPAGDVFDPASGAQYYYHSHRHDAPEHGHFHVFIRPNHLPEKFEPLRHSKPGVGRCAGERRIGANWPRGEAALAHLIAIAMDNYGLPVRLFTVNRWVTDETWFSARDLVAMLERFELSHDYPSPAVNRWLVAILRLFQPDIAELIRRRDAAVEARARANPRADALEDRSLEVTAAVDISVDRRVRQLRRSLGT